jgi:hypothetical protein
MCTKKIKRHRHSMRVQTWSLLIIQIISNCLWKMLLKYKSKKFINMYISEVFLCWRTYLLTVYLSIHTLSYDHFVLITHQKTHLLITSLCFSFFFFLIFISGVYPTKLFFFANEEFFRFSLVSLHFYYKQKKIIDWKMT